jgi:Bacterial membrane protein YfhO
MRLIIRLVEIGRARPDRTAIVVLAVLPFLLFAPALLPGRALTPVDQLFLVAPWSAMAPARPQANPALADVSQVFHPWTLYTAREVRGGRLPLWNPYAYAGVPFLSNPQTALFFPLTWLTWVLPATLALTLPQVLKVAVAGPAMYWFLRMLAISPLAAFIGGAGFMLSTTLIAWLPWTYSTTMVFLPILFGLVERLTQRVDRRTVALLGLALAADMLAGYPPSAFHGVLATVAWALVRAPWRAGPLRYLAGLGAAGILGAGLTAVQMLPAFDYMRDSTVYFYRSQWTPPLAAGTRSALTALMPYYFGVGTQSWSGWQFGIMSTYVGVVVLLALPLALLAWRRSATVPLAVMVVGVAAIHYGAPGMDALADAPGMALVNKLRLMPLLVFPVCALGALGLDAATARSAGVPTRPTIAIRAWFVVLVVIGLAAVARVIGDPVVAEMRPSLVTQFLAFLIALTTAALLLLRWLADGRARWGVALAALQVASLAPIAATYLPVRDARWLYPTPPAITWLQQHAGGARAVMADQVGFLYGIRQASGYDGLTPRRIEQVAGPIGSGNALLAGYVENVASLHGSEPLAPLSVLFSPVRDLVGVRYIVLGRYAEPPGPGLRLAYDGPDARIFENPAALPRAFVARRARCVDDRAALALLRSHAVDASAEVLLADCAAPLTVGPPAQSRQARIEVDESERVVVAAATDAPAWLVLTDTWFPGWTARLDGGDVPIARANHAFRAVALPAGHHRVEFTFRPRGLRLGAAITLVSLGAVLALLFRWRPRAAATVGVVALVLSASAAHAALPAPPFELTVAPATFVSGSDPSVTVRPRGGAGGRWDLYVVWLYSERAVFLGADGAWHPRPTPFRAGAAAGETATVTWKNAGPAGEATLALLTVDRGGNPLERLDWRFRPSLATVKIGAPPMPRSLPYDTLAVLLVASLGAIALVLRWARWPSPRAVDRTRSTSRRPLPADSRP